MPELNGDSDSRGGRHEESDKIGNLSHGRAAWEGDFQGLHSLALVNRAICRGLVERGIDLGLIQVEAGPDEDRVALDGRLAARMGKKSVGGTGSGAREAPVAAAAGTAGAGALGAHAALGIWQLAESLAADAPPSG